jgi:hypothetical protein
MPANGRLTRQEREQRDQRVMGLFLDGASYREIGAAVGLRSVSGVHRIVQRELASSARRRGLLSDEAFAVWQERSESLLQAHWGLALKGDHRSAEICRKILAQQAGVYGIGAESLKLPAGTRADAVEPDRDDDGQDELARLRAARAKRFAF